MEQLMKMSIPDELEKDYLTGAINITAAVGRNTENGRITSYCDLTPYYQTDSTKKMYSSGQVAIAVGVASLVSITVGGIITYVVEKRKSKKKRIEIPKCMLNFQTVFKQYLNEAKVGIYDIATIRELLLILDEIENTTNTDIVIDFTTDEIKTLLNIILQCTEQFQTNNSDEIQKISLSENSKSNLNVLKRCLSIQREYLENTA